MTKRTAQKYAQVWVTNLLEQKKAEFRKMLFVQLILPNDQEDVVNDLAKDLMVALYFVLTGTRDQYAPIMYRIEGVFRAMHADLPPFRKRVDFFPFLDAVIELLKPEVD